MECLKRMLAAVTVLVLSLYVYLLSPAPNADAAPLDLAQLLEKVSHEDATVRENTVRMMGRIKDTRAVEALMRSLNDSDAGVRWNAAMSLAGSTIPSRLNP